MDDLPDALVVCINHNVSRAGRQVQPVTVRFAAVAAPVVPLFQRLLRADEREGDGFPRPRLGNRAMIGGLRSGDFCQVVPRDEMEDQVFRSIIRHTPVSVSVRNPDITPDMLISRALDDP